MKEKGLYCNILKLQPGNKYREDRREGRGLGRGTSGVLMGCLRIQWGWIEHHVFYKITHNLRRGQAGERWGKPSFGGLENSALYTYTAPRQNTTATKKSSHRLPFPPRCNRKKLQSRSSSKFHLSKKSHFASVRCLYVMSLQEYDSEILVCTPVYTKPKMEERWRLSVWPITT